MTTHDNPVVEGSWMLREARARGRNGAGLWPILVVLILGFAPGWSGASPRTEFEIRITPGLHPSSPEGRLFIILGLTNVPEPRELLGNTGLGSPLAFAVDFTNVHEGALLKIDQTAFGFPVTNFSQVPAADYFLQAVFDSSRELRLPDAPGNLFSKPRWIHFRPDGRNVTRLELSEQVPPETLPPNTPQLRFLKIQSRLLSEFDHRPIFLRAGILLPQNYDREPARRFPLWVRVGGFGTRYWTLQKLMGEGSHFKEVWEDPETPPFILLQLDGAGPYGDPYYVNSANNGPYGDALTQELIPYVETHFRAAGGGGARVLSGSSTGGWVSLALQIFYPDFFAGTWSSCPDPVDFRAFELVNIYEGTNAYVNEFGNERPSERSLLGDVVLTMRREVGMENLLGRGNSYACSGGQWGAWNAVYGPRGLNGQPELLWDPLTGAINHRVAEAWKPYDLRLVLRDHWQALSPKLQGKLHIASGEADQYFLNNAVHLLEQDLATLPPGLSPRIAYGPGKPHGWMDISLEQMLREMNAATQGMNK